MVRLYKARKNKPDTGDSLHTQEPVTVASFRTWRGWREYVARGRYLTQISLPSTTKNERTIPFRVRKANNNQIAWHRPGFDNPERFHSR